MAVDNGTSSVVTTSVSVANGSDQDVLLEVTANCNPKSGAVEDKAKSYDSESSTRDWYALC